MGDIHNENDIEKNNEKNIEKKSKVLLLLGASSDVGIKYIEEYGKKYDKIFAHYNCSSLELNNLISDGFDIIEPVRADLLDDEDIDRLISTIKGSEYTPTNIVFLPARSTTLKKIEEVDIDSLISDFKMQVIASSKLISAFISPMKEAKYGRICFMLSSVTYQPVTYNYSYMISKYALWGEMRAMAKEFAPFGITVNAISPTMIDTKFVKDTSPFVKKKMIDMSPLKRLATTDEIIPAIDFFMSEDSSYITGDNLLISGGAS
mgnify:CR=1 FL=1